MGCMKKLLLSIVGLSLAVASASAYSDYIYNEQPLIHPSFDALIPTFHPTIQPNFDELIPTTRPLICPGIPQIHIIDNLIHPTDQPLLIVN